MTVVTLLEEPVQSVLATAGMQEVVYVHATSLADCVHLLRWHASRAFLCSPALLSRHSPNDVHQLFRETPGVSTIAVVANDRVVDANTLLGLGWYGLRRLINLDRREGWDCLRNSLRDAGNEVTALISAVLLEALDDATIEARHFFAEMIRIAPTATTVRRVAEHFSIDASTLTSRFFRAQLPAPKDYLAMVRLAYAAAYLNPLGASLAAVADRLNYSSPQAFGRHVRFTIGMRGAAYRNEYTLERVLDRILGEMVTPYWKTMRHFRPIEARALSRSAPYTPKTPQSVDARTA